ncbi:MAG: DUF87 domain-containing protein [Candidatus Woesebacteria bacterium]
MIDLFKNNLVVQIILGSLSASVSVPTLSLSFDSYLPILLSVVMLVCLLICIVLVLKVLAAFLRVQIQLRQNYTFLELHPPTETLQSSYATQQLFLVLHGLTNYESWIHRLVGYQKSYAFEIVSTKHEGIRYILRVRTEDVDIIKKGLLSYLPGMRIKEADDYLSPSVSRERVVIAEWSTRTHFAFPLQSQNVLEEHDPIAYLTGSMTKLAPDELVAFQIVASPVNKKWVTDIKRLSHILYTNTDLVQALTSGTRKGFISTVIHTSVLFCIHLVMLPIGVIVFIATGGNEGPFLSFPFEKIKKKTLNPYQTELETLVKAKLDQQLFSTSIRVLAIGKARESHTKIRGFASALSSFATAYQSLRFTPLIRLQFLYKLQLFIFQHRLIGFFGHSILSVPEVSDLYHFPYTTTTQTEDIQKVHSRELPAPVSLKSAADFDVVFARNTYGGTTTPIGLNIEERRRHMYILGATGTGKSTMLLSMIKQDIEHGKGVCVIDPHGDLIENILPLIPENRINDVVYVNPDDIHFPVGLNLLEIPPELTGDLLLREKEVITESIISLFHKLYDARYSGPRMEYILRNTIHTAFLTPNPTLFTIYKLLINDDYRNQVIPKIQDENLHDFWKYEFSTAGDYQKVSMISPITNKIGRFLFSPIAKRILEQEKSTIDFDDIINSGKILLCNVSKGKIGEDNSQVFGSLLMTKIQLAALKRARMKSEERKDFYLYVDEFQNFATPSFAQILSEARKYRLNAILAHQTTSQLEDKSLVNVTLANTGTIICFRTANPEDERLILPQFQPYVREGEIGNLPAYHFYAKISGLQSQEPFSGETIPIVETANQVITNRVIKRSRRLYSTEYQEPKEDHTFLSQKKIQRQRTPQMKSINFS